MVTKRCLIILIGLLSIALFDASLTIAEKKLIVPAVTMLLSDQKQSDIVAVRGDQLVRNGVRFEFRGMNYYPKDYAWGRFWNNYKSSEVSKQIDEKLAVAESMGTNTVRIFVPYNLENPMDINDLSDFVNRLKMRGMSATVTLFDLVGSTNIPYLDFDSSKAYIREIVSELGKNNPSALAWDIKNELDRDYGKYGVDEDDTDSVEQWARAMIAETRRLDPKHLNTIGFYGVKNNVYDPVIPAEFAADVDFISMHYFLSEQSFE